ncbi:MAG: ABC transporter ATP-binding protein [Acidobacteriota bacterium]|nr:ABC transporter ATP-binding protein [Acidobacteriota bacterium]
MSAVISVEKLSKWYGNVLGLSDVTLDIEAGITGILGPNGAGKSTFLKLITGQIKSNIGTVRLKGETVWNNPSLFARIGFCPEQDAFFEELSGKCFLLHMLKLSGFSGEECERRAARALETVDLTGAGGRVIRSYSRGMRQRIKIAQSIAHDPDVLIMDEPLNGLDPLGRRKIIRLIKEFKSEGRTVIVSSHVLPEIEAMTNQIVLIHQGKIFAQGDIHYIRDLIESHPHMISIKCSRPRLLAARFIEEKDVIDVRFHEDGEMIVETNDRDSFFGRLPSLLLKNDIDIHEISSPDDNLQAVFDYLIGS